MNKTTDRQYVQMELPLECTVTSNVLNGCIKMSRKPVGYWNIKENCERAAKECRSISEFHHRYRRAWQEAKKYGWIEEWFERILRPRGYWTKEKCSEVAMQSVSRAQMRIEFPTAYQLAVRNGWIDEFFVRIYRHTGSFTKEYCQRLAQRCGSRSQFKKQEVAAYKKSLKNGWLNEWLPRIRNRPCYYTKERCTELAKLCESRSEFQRKFETAWKYSKREGWIEEFFWLSNKNVHKNGYFVYVYLFSDRTFYVGVSCRKIGIRDYEHRSGIKYSACYQHFQETGCPIPKAKILEVNLSSNEAREKEKSYIALYKNQGLIALNKAEAGALGGCAYKWQKKRIIELAKKCRTRVEFQKRFNRAYNSARYNGWLKEVYEKANLMINRSLAKEVYVFDAGYGDFLFRYDSISEASRELGVAETDIGHCMKGERNFAKGFIFRGSKNSPKRLFDYFKRVIQYDANWNFVRLWKNQVEYRHVYGRDISTAIKRGHKYKGFYFRYATKQDLVDLKEQKTPKPYCFQDDIRDNNPSETTYTQPELPLAM